MAAVAGLTIGDTRAWLASLPPASVGCIVTSPPYWALRDYPIPPSVWGGTAGCEHQWGEALTAPWANGLPGAAVPGKGAAKRRRARTAGQWCQVCGAWYGRLGGEPTIAQYVTNLVTVGQLLHRVLRDTGTLWLNLGDTYIHRSARSGRRASSDGLIDRGEPAALRAKAHDTLKHKDLALVPQRVALALQDAGWYVRSWLVWEKPNALPESVTDRPSTSHETLLLLTKAPSYYYDHALSQEPVTGNAHRRGASATPKDAHAGGRANGSFHAATGELVQWRNVRSVWSIPTEPFPGEHDSTFPLALVRRCVLAGAERGWPVLDPFAGTGTVAQVCQEEGYPYLGCDADPRAVRWHARRLAQRPLCSSAGLALATSGEE